MNSIEPPHILRRLIECEHRELDQTVRDIRRKLSAEFDAGVIAAELSAVRQRLVDLRTHLQDHFSREESGGLLEEAVTRMPRLASDSDAVIREHPELIDEVSKLIAAIDAEGAPSRAWTELGTGFASFARRLLAHEATENRILQHGLNVDLDLAE